MNASTKKAQPTFHEDADAVIARLEHRLAQTKAERSSLESAIRSAEFQRSRNIEFGVEKVLPTIESVVPLGTLLPRFVEEHPALVLAATNYLATTAKHEQGWLYKWFGYRPNSHVIEGLKLHGQMQAQLKAWFNTHPEQGVSQIPALDPKILEDKERVRELARVEDEIRSRIDMLDHARLATHPAPEHLTTAVARAARHIEQRPLSSSSSSSSTSDDAMGMIMGTILAADLMSSIFDTAPDGQVAYQPEFQGNGGDFGGGGADASYAAPDAAADQSGGFDASTTDLGSLS